MSVLTFDGAVLVRHPGVVAGRYHLVVRAQRLIATGLVEPGIVIEIAERGRETVGAVLDRHAAERPKGVLQADGERGETLAPQHRLGMLPSRVGQHEVIQPMIQRLAGNADADIGHVGEIRLRLLSRHMVLTEDHLAIGAVFGAPGTNPTLQASTQPIPILTGMTQLHLLEQGNWSQTGMRLEHRADLAIP
jgi:hypothetical protein